MSLAKRTAAGLIRSLSGDDRVAVLPTVPGPGGGEPEDMSGRAALARLDKIPQTAAAGDAVRGLRAAMERAAASKDRRRIVILSDMQGWMASGDNVGGAPTEAFAGYRERTGADPHVYSFDLQGYGTLMFPERNVYALAGFSEKVFDVMALLERDRGALVHEIEAVALA